jgi:hypothetical protein
VKYLADSGRGRLDLPHIGLSPILGSSFVQLSHINASSEQAAWDRPIHVVEGEPIVETTGANGMQPSLIRRLPIAMGAGAIALAALAIVTAAVHAFKTARITYEVALVDHASARKTFLALNRVMSEEDSWMSLQRVQVAGVKAAADDQRSGATDFAVLLPDVAMPSRAREIVTLSRDSALLIVPAKSPIESLRDLQGQTVRVALSSTIDEALLDRLLA